MRPTILLFDIDGTLIDAGGAGRRAIERAFLARYGRPNACAGFSLGGMTDRAIVRTALAAVGQAQDAEVIDAVLGVYLEMLSLEMAGSFACRIHAGIEDVLQAVTARAGCAVGLGTGNVREGARMKLAKVGLHERFSFGGFGCDHEDRGELLRIGAARGARALGVPLSDCRVVVIGDTPKDVAAAQAIGAESVAVATGAFSVAALTAAGATIAFADLTHAAALGVLLGGAP